MVKATHLDNLVVLGTLTSRAARFLDACVVTCLNVLVAGGTQAGKTTLVNWPAYGTARVSSLSQRTAAQQRAHEESERIIA